MIKVNLYTAKGTKRPQISLTKQFEQPINDILLAQAIRVYESRSHAGLSKIKTRGEVISSKRKIYRQKGTGRARHGARSAPIFVGGGKAHGPKGVKRELSMPNKMKRAALDTCLSLKAKEKEVVVVSNLSELKKTKEAAVLINKIVGTQYGDKKNARFTFVIHKDNKGVLLALRNIPNVTVVQFENIDAYKVFHGGILVLDKKVLDENKKSPRAKAGSKKKSTKSISAKKTTKKPSTRKK